MRIDACVVVECRCHSKPKRHDPAAHKHEDTPRRGGILAVDKRPIDGKVPLERDEGDDESRGVASELSNGPVKFTCKAPLCELPQGDVGIEGHENWDESGYEVVASEPYHQHIR